MRLTPAGGMPALALLLLERDVYDAPYLVHGLPALIVVTSSHEVIGPIAIHPGVSRESAKASLRALLDVIDPVVASFNESASRAPLALVRPG